MRAEHKGAAHWTVLHGHRVAAEGTEQMAGKLIAAQLYIQAEPPPAWQIILMGVPSVILTALAVLSALAPVTFFRESDWVTQAELLGVTPVFLGVAGWSWSRVFTLYLRHRHYTDIYIAVTDTDLIYQNYDAIGRLKRICIPRANIIRVVHFDALICYDEPAYEWRVYIQYWDARGRKKELRIDYEDLFPMAWGTRLIHMLQK